MEIIIITVAGLSLLISALHVAYEIGQNRAYKRWDKALEDPTHDN